MQKFPSKTRRREWIIENDKKRRNFIKAKLQIPKLFSSSQMWMAMTIRISTTCSICNCIFENATSSRLHRCVVACLILRYGWRFQILWKIKEKLKKYSKVPNICTCTIRIFFKFSLFFLALEKLFLLILLKKGFLYEVKPLKKRINRNNFSSAGEKRGIFTTNCICTFIR